jgi:TolB protein
MIGYYDSSETHIQITSDYYNETHASWSPNGKLICFSRDVNGRFDIWITDDRGEEQRPLTTNPGIDVQPEWSPDGGTIAYISKLTLDEDDVPQVYSISSKGGKPAKLTKSPGEKYDPCWSPDGSLIYFITHNVNENMYLLKSVDPESLEEELIAGFREKIVRPYVSPDNNSFIYSIGGKGRRAEIYMYDVISGREIRLTDNLHRDADPRWAR